MNIMKKALRWIKYAAKWYIDEAAASRYMTPTGMIPFNGGME